MYSKIDLKRAALFTFFITLFFPSLLMAMDVDLAWEPSNDPNVVGYRLYVREDIEDYNYSFPEWEGAETRGTIIGLDQYESYFFVVRAFDHQGNESDNSNEVYLPANYDDNQLDPGTGGGGGIGGGAIGGGDGAAGGGGGGGGCFISDFFGRHRL
jgi:uncharacterized membrane protein YgcG